MLLAELLEREVGAPLKVGVDRFEELLKCIGLSGSVPDGVGRTIFEMGQVRNVLVHRGGIVDRRFVSACPWLGLNPGDKVSVDRESLSRFASAALDYAVVYLQRAHLALRGSPLPIPITTALLRTKRVHAHTVGPGGIMTLRRLRPPSLACRVWCMAAERSPRGPDLVRVSPTSPRPWSLGVDARGLAWRRAARG